MKHQTIIGIDNGIRGGLCVISSFDGSVIGYIAMPIKQVGGKSEVDVNLLLEWIEPYRKSVMICIEEPTKHTKSSQAMRSMSISFGLIVGACEAKKYDVRRVQVKEWQNEVLGKKLMKGTTKPVALEVAKRLWPEESWLATSRSKVPHDGLIDAALVAFYHYNQTKQ